MGNLIKGLKVAAYVAEIIVAGSVVSSLQKSIVANSEKRRLPRVKSRPLMLRLKTDSTSDEWIMTRKRT